MEFIKQSHIIQMPCRNTADSTLYFPLEFSCMESISNPWKLMCVVRNHVSDTRGGWQCIPASEGGALWAALYGVAIPKQGGVWWEKHRPVWAVILWGRDGRQCQYSRQFILSHLVAALWPHRLPQCLNMARHRSFPSFQWIQTPGCLPRAVKKISETVFGNKISLQNSICLSQEGTAGWTCYSLPWFGFWCIYSGWDLN